MHPRKQDGQQEVNEDGYQFGNLQESQSIDKLLGRIFGNQIGKSGKPRIENQVFLDALASLKTMLDIK